MKQSKDHLLSFLVHTFAESIKRSLVSLFAVMGGVELYVERVRVVRRYGSKRYAKTSTSTAIGECGALRVHHKRVKAAMSLQFAKTSKS
jgi:hypothetical protein